MEVVLAEGWQVSSCEREVDIKQPQQVTPSVHGWLFNKNRHQPLPCPPGACKCTCWLFFITTINFWYFLLEVVGFALFEESLCNPSPFSGTLLSPCLPLWAELFPALLLAASPCPSPFVSVESCAGHCTLPSFWGFVLPFPTHSCSHVLVRQAVSWVDGCFSAVSTAWLPPCLVGWLGESWGVRFPPWRALRHGMHWLGFPLLSHNPEGTWATPLSFHRLKAAQN